MKDFSAIVIGLVPALFIWQFGYLNDSGDTFLYASLVAIAVSLIVYHLLKRWHHGAVLTTLGILLPLLFYIYVTVQQPIFLPIFYGMAALIGVAGVLGSAVCGQGWQGIIINTTYMFTLFFLVVVVGSHINHICVEASLLAAGAFAIARLCAIDLFGWLPRTIYSGMQKLWS